MDTLVILAIIGLVIFIVMLLRSGRRPPRSRGGGEPTVGGIDLPTWVAMEENLYDDDPDP